MRQQAGALVYPESVDLVDRSERLVTVGVLDRLLRVGEGKTLRRLEAMAVAVNAIEGEFIDLSDAELRALTQEYKDRYQGGESLDELLPEAFATVREAARRTWASATMTCRLWVGPHCIWAISPRCAPVRARPWSLLCPPT